MIALRDNTPVPDDVIVLCRDIQDQVYSADYTLVDLMDLSDQKDEPPKIFQYWDNGIFAVGNYVGQIEYHGKDGTVEQVVIGARGPGFHSSGEADLRDRQGRSLLRAMLEDCWEIPLHFLESDLEVQQGEQYGELLATRLAAQLDRAWRKGALRFYRTFPRRDSRVQGRLDIPREIRLGKGLRDGRMAYEIREFTGDNDYNRLFLQACLAAEQQYPQLMLSMRKLLPDYGTAFQALRSSSWGRLDTNTLLGRTQKKITNPIYREYETLRGISRAFLRRQGDRARTNGHGAPFVTGILLDLSQLWERYLLKKILPAAGRSYQAEEYILGGNMQVFPDFLWKGDHVVLDAKYKPHWGDTFSRPNGNWKGSIHQDVYQLLSYMLELDCYMGGVIFPVDQDGFLEKSGAASMEALADQPERLRIPVGGRCGFSFWRFPFAVPSEGTDHEAFRLAMDQEAERLSVQIRDRLFQAGPS